MLQTQQFFADIYGLHHERDIYRHLPLRTDTFDQEHALLHQGDALQLEHVAWENYQQPDFYPTFDTTGKKMWTDASQHYPSRSGWAATPAEQEATLHPGDEFETVLFVGASWGSTRPQGTGLTLRAQGGVNITVTPDPSSLLLGRTFPAFDANWVHRVILRGKVGEDVNEGTYHVALYLTAPPSDHQTTWTHLYPSYVNVDTAYIPPEGIATLTLHVVQKEN